MQFAANVWGVILHEKGYFGEAVDFESLRIQGAGGKIAREHHRSESLKRAFQKTKDCDLVFCDPDNEIERAHPVSSNDKTSTFTYC